MKARETWNCGNISESLKEAIADEIESNVAAALKEYIHGEESILYLTETGDIAFLVDPIPTKTTALRDQVQFMIEANQTKTGELDGPQGVEIIAGLLEIFEACAADLKAALSKRA